MLAIQLIGGNIPSRPWAVGIFLEQRRRQFDTRLRQPIGLRRQSLAPSLMAFGTGIDSTTDQRSPAASISALRAAMAASGQTSPR